MREVRFKDYWTFFWGLVSGTRLTNEMDTARLRKEKTRTYLDYAHPLNVLDLGSGALQPQYALFEAEGHNVIGVDLLYANQRKFGERQAYRFAQWLYKRPIQRDIVSSLQAGLLGAEVSQLPLKSRQFDLVTSIAAFEHFLKMNEVILELHRVLKPGGILFSIIHPFTALSGGHNVRLTGLPITSLPTGVEPWDHLRKRRIPIGVPLNEWRIKDYRDAFKQSFDIVEEGCWMREGEMFLTPELEAELDEYSREELLTGTYLLIARKPIKNLRQPDGYI